MRIGKLMPDQKFTLINFNLFLYDFHLVITRNTRKKKQALKCSASILYLLAYIEYWKLQICFFFQWTSEEIFICALELIEKCNNSKFWKCTLYYIVVLYYCMGISNLTGQRSPTKCQRPNWTNNWFATLYYNFNEFSSYINPLL